MSFTKEGGPVFPVRDGDRYFGISLRDYFAAHAPDAPYLWQMEWKDREEKKMSASETYVMRSWMVHGLAEWRWIYADAMLETRNPIIPERK